MVGALSVAIVLAAPAAPPARLVAVLDLTGDLPASDLRFYTAALRDGVVGAGKFRVQSRQEMDEVARTQSFNHCDLADESCGVDLGRLLQVGWLVSGQLRAGKSGLAASLTLLNVESGAIETSLTETCAGCDEASAVGWLKSLGTRLAGGTPAAAGANASAPEASGTLAVESVPAGAEVLLDGRPTGLATPVLLAGVSAGTHDIVLRLARFADGRRAATVVAGEQARVRVELTRLTGHLALSSPDSAAQCTVDGAHPLALAEGGLEDVALDDGEHVVACEGPGRLPREERVDVPAGGRASLAVRLERVPAAEEEAARRHGMRVLGWAVATGAGAALAGGALWYRSSKLGDVRAGTLGTGADIASAVSGANTALLAGAAAGGVAAVLLVVTGVTAATDRGEPAP